jgi:hypothetical protein
MAASTILWEDGVVSNATGVLMQYAFLCWTLTFMVLFRKLADRSPRYAVYGLAFAILGCFAGNNFGQEGLYIHALNLDPLQLREAINAQPAFVLTLFMPGAMFPISVIVLAVMLIRHKRIPNWVGIMLLLGTVAFPVSRIPRITLVGLLADLLMAAPLIYLGLQRLQSSSESPELATMTV